MRSSRGRSPGSKPVFAPFSARAKILLEHCSFFEYQREHCSNNSEITQMQSLPVQIATTFVSDAFAFVNGLARIATHILMAPVERIAKACDVAGILHERALRGAEREQIRLAWRVLSRDTPKP